MPQRRIISAVWLSTLVTLSSCSLDEHNPFSKQENHGFVTEPAPVDTSPWKFSKLLNPPAVVDFDDSLDSEHVAALERAISHWNDAAGMELLTMGEKVEEDNNQTNIVKFEWCGMIGEGAIATTFPQPNDKGSGMLGFDIYLNGETHRFEDVQPGTEREFGKRTIVDIEAVLIHELGHGLGLLHVPLECGRSVMHPRLEVVEKKPTKLDQGLLNEIYRGTEPIPADCKVGFYPIIDDPNVYPQPHVPNEEFGCPRTTFSQMLE